MSIIARLLFWIYDRKDAHRDELTFMEKADKWAHVQFNEVKL